MPRSFQMARRQRNPARPISTSNQKPQNRIAAGEQSVLIGRAGGAWQLQRGDLLSYLSRTPHCAVRCVVVGPVDLSPSRGAVPCTTCIGGKCTVTYPTLTRIPSLPG